MEQGLTRWISVASIIASLMMSAAVTLNGAWAQTGSDQPEAPTTVIILRHADKAGTAGNVDLSVAGEIRARKLAQVCSLSGLAALYGVTYTGDDLRVRLTLEPIAKLLNVQPTILLDANNIHTLVQDIRTKHLGKTVLVVSHSGTVQAIIKTLGGDDTRCSTDTYDNLCVVTMCGLGKVNVLRLKYGAIQSP